jgi:hypothetical protein
MSDITHTPDTCPVPIPVGELLPWTIFAGVILLLAIYFVGAEDGATSLISGMYVHEFVHDGRHLLEQFSAVVLWRFRVGSLGIHVVLWTTIGLLFGALAERSFAERFGQRLSVGAVRR